MSATRSFLCVAMAFGNSNMPLQGRNGHLWPTTRVHVPPSQKEHSFERLRQAIVCLRPWN